MDTKDPTAVLKDLARTFVGDEKIPNVFFVTNTETGDTIAVFVGDDMDDHAIAFADRLDEPLMVEDRLNGVVHDNLAGERLQERLRAEEEAGERLQERLRAEEEAGERLQERLRAEEEAE